MRFAAALVSVFLATPAAFAADAMPVARQNELVQKYCAVCHTDASQNGGLSLEHFDAATAAPSLAAMMLSKLTSGVALATVRAAATDPSAAALLAQKMKGGAMGAAGLPIPDQETVDAFVRAFVAQAAADEWHASTSNQVTTASIAGEAPSAERPGEAAIYRLVISCNAATGQGDMQLAWSPAPRSGTLLAAADGNPPLSFPVEGTEKMGNGSAAIAGPAAVQLYKATTIPLPAETMAFSNLFPDQRVEFPFDRLAPSARQAFSACLAD
jgi:hypothetical protein